MQALRISPGKLCLGVRVAFPAAHTRGKIAYESSTRVVIEGRDVDRRPVSLTQRAVAGIANVNRSYPQELQKAGILGSSLGLEDALVTMCVGSVPLRWTRGVDDPSLKSGLLEKVAVLARQYARSSEIDSILAVTRERTQRVSRPAATSLAAESQDGLLLLPVGLWWELVKASGNSEVPMT